MLNGGRPTRSPVVIYYRTQSRARMAHILFGTAHRFTIASYRRSKLTTADGGRLLASPPGETTARQRHAVWLWPHGLRTGSTLTGADRWSPGHGPGVWCRAIRVTVLERDDSAAWNNFAGCKVDPLPAITAGPCAGRGPTRVPDSGDDIASGRRPTPHHRLYKGTSHRAV